MKQEYIRVGRIVNAHGIRGEVRVQPPGSPPTAHPLQNLYIDGRHPHRQPRPQGAGLAEISRCGGHERRSHL